MSSASAVSAVMAVANRSSPCWFCSTYSVKITPPPGLSTLNQRTGWPMCCAASLRPGGDQQGSGRDGDLAVAEPGDEVALDGVDGPAHGVRAAHTHLGTDGRAVPEADG